LNTPRRIAQKAHVAILHTIEDANAEPGGLTGENSVPRHCAKFPFTAGAAREHEIICGAERRP
jgi:hypothetical protein